MGRKHKRETRLIKSYVGMINISPWAEKDKAGFTIETRKSVPPPTGKRRRIIKETKSCVGTVTISVWEEKDGAGFTIEIEESPSSHDVANLSAAGKVDLRDHFIREMDNAEDS